MMFNIPVIAYHKISNEPEFGLTTVLPLKFEQQIQELFKRNYHPITFDYIQNGNPLPEKPIIITFDDGFESVYSFAFPILKKYGFTAVIFIITDFIGKECTWEPLKRQQIFRHLNREQILDLTSNGFEIGSHGKKHLLLNFLSEKKLLNELIESKKYLEELTGNSIVSFCYPYGRYSCRVKKSVQSSGYFFAAGNIRFFNHNASNYSIMRRTIYSSDSLDLFIKKVEKSKVINDIFLKEWIIQKGALASISLSLLKNT